MLEPMHGVAAVLVGLVALLHAGFGVLEMFLWTAPTGRNVFAMTAEFADATRALAANQGLYNGFLSAGLVWGLLAARDDVKIFFCGCAIIAGGYGAITVNSRILFVQTLPAALAFLAVLATG